jgi:hypothetical protein
MLYGFPVEVQPTQGMIGMKPSSRAAVSDSSWILSTTPALP